MLGVDFASASLHSWQSTESFDLITCVHGLHYIGDKLGLLSRVTAWMETGGLFAGNLDLADLRDERGASLGSELAGRLRALGARYSAKTRVLHLSGGQPLELPYEHLGSDDSAGPNSTHQATVRSYYRPSGR